MKSAVLLMELELDSISVDDGPDSKCRSRTRWSIRSASPTDWLGMRALASVVARAGLNAFQNLSKQEKFCFKFWAPEAVCLF
jgi:hypothetical protein